MNRKLLDPFQAIALPETIEEYLEHGTATSIALNRRGTLLAAGTAEGSVVVWDFGTKGVAKKYSGHASAVTGVCWSRDGRHIASGSEDRHVVLWDVLSGTQESRVELPSAVATLSISPRAPFQCVASLSDGSAVIIDMDSKITRTLPVFGKGEESPGSVAIMNKKGDFVLQTQSRDGYLALLDPMSLRCHDLIKLPRDVRVEGLSLNRHGNLLLIAGSDGVIRMFEVQQLPGKPKGGYEMKEVDKFLAQNEKVSSCPVYSTLLGAGGVAATKSSLLVQHVRDFQSGADHKSPWRSACFSSDSAHVIGASANKAEHALYIWSRQTGHLERVLEGPKEDACAVIWHPLRSMLISLSGAGRVLCWARIYSENWSAFAPDFKELEENLEYVEREDEFDWNTPGCTAGTSPSKMSKEGSHDEDEEETVDILTKDDARVMSSDEEEELEGQLHYLPAVIEADEIRDAPAGDDVAQAASARGCAAADFVGDAVTEGNEEQAAVNDGREEIEGTEKEEDTDQSDDEGGNKAGAEKRKRARR